MFTENKRLYLSGPIEEGSGPNWRIDPVKTFRTVFKLDVFDPYSDPKQQWLQPLKDAKASKDFELVTKIAKSFVRKDLAMVDRADILAAYLPYRVPTVGTVHEIINSVNAKKPTLLVCPEGKEKIPSWYFGFIPESAMFSSFEELYEYLHQVNNGLLRDNNRWSFIYGSL